MSSKNSWSCDITISTLTRRLLKRGLSLKNFLITPLVCAPLIIDAFFKEINFLSLSLP
jgi:hypothetical protein